MDEIWLVLRTAVALAVVLGLVWFGARRLNGPRRDAGMKELQVRVLDRTLLSRHSGIAVVAVGDRRLLVGYGEQQVELLSELTSAVATRPASVNARPVKATVDESANRTLRLDGGRVTEASAGAGPIRVGTTETSRRPQPAFARESLKGIPGLTANEPGSNSGFLAGSLLSPRTWRNTIQVLQDRTVLR